MKIRYILSTIFLLILISSIHPLFAQKMEPEKVDRIVYSQKSDEWYRQQAELWQTEISKNPKNSTAWHNFYNAVRYENFNQTIGTPEKKAKLQKIVDDMGKHVPDSFEYNYLKFFTADDKTSLLKYLEKAHEIAPERPDPLYEFIPYLELNNDAKRVTEIYNKLYKTKDLATWLVDYNYNVLMSTEPNAILFTNGDNDTYPARMLQEVKNIRTDVTVLNIPMSTSESYLKRILSKKDVAVDHKTLVKKAITESENGSKKFSVHRYTQALCTCLAEKYPKIPLYFALTVYEPFHKPFKEDLYITGLAYRYSPKRIDNIALIKKNLEENFRLDYLENDWYNDLDAGVGLMNTMNLNYVPAMMMLMVHEKTSGQSEAANHWKKLATDIAKRAGKEDWIEDIEKRGFE